MPVLPFGSYRPDVTDYNGQHTQTATNVFPQADGFGPVQSLIQYTAALSGACRGFFYARKNDGTILIFAATSVRLYIYVSGSNTWTDVSKGAVDYPVLPTSGQWQFRQFNNFVFAVQANAPPQVYDLTAGPTTFADLGGSPPQAAYIAIVNRFVVLSGLASPNVYRVQWSGLNATTTWTSGVTQSDFQDLADGGLCRGVAGGEFGIIFQDTSIRRMTYAPGSPYVFGIDRISVDDGLLAPYSLVNAGDRIFFLSPQGFKMLLPGGYPQPIGKEKFDRTFLADVDQTQLQMIIGATDPRRTRVYWAYKSVNGIAGQFDRIVVYDWALQEGAIINQRGEYLATLSQAGIGLDDSPFPYGSSVDAQTIGSWDNISVATYSQLGGAFTDHTLGFFAGPNMEAVLETAEQSGDGRRFRVRGMRPITDASAALCSVKYRNTIQTLPSQTAEASLDRRGQCSANVSTRYARARVRIPANSVWTFATGVEPDIIPEGAQ